MKFCTKFIFNISGFHIRYRGQQYIGARKFPLVFSMVILLIIPELLMGLWSQEKEKLLFADIPVVITASRKEQPMTEAPSTIAVITSEDIRYSGAITIPDLLRRIAGVDVMAITMRNQQVGIRGLNSPMNNKLMVLVDGRSVYMDINGRVSWEGFAVGLEEIDRIEVVKTPISVLYGANAYSGVINVITKTPQQLHGTMGKLTIGDPHTLIGSVIHAGEAAKGKISYKVSAEWNKITEQWGPEDKEKGKAITRLNALLQYKPGEKSKLELSAGRTLIKDENIFPGGIMGVMGQGTIAKGTLDYLQLDFEYGALRFRTFFRQGKDDVRWSQDQTQQLLDIKTYNVELYHTFHLGKTHSLIWGLNYKYDKLKKATYYLDDYNQHFWGFFLEDELRFTEKLRLTIGGRYDTHPLVGGHFSPRANIFYSPAKNHIFRLSVAKAYRSPAFMDSYAYIERRRQMPLAPPLPPIRVPFLSLFQGNQNLDPEGITSYELGYHTTPNPHISLDINLFYNQYGNLLVRQRTLSFYEENEVFPGSPGGVIRKKIILTPVNGANARGIGGEANLDFSISQWISGFLNYSYQDIFDNQDDPETTWINEKDRRRPGVSRHKLNAGFRILFKNGFSLNLLAHWVDKTQEIINSNQGPPSGSPLPGPPTGLPLVTMDDYFLVNTRVGYLSKRKNIELALSVLNLLNEDPFRLPFQANLPLANEKRNRRRIVFTMEISF